MAGHAQRAQDALGDELLPGFSAHRLDQLPGRQVQHVVIGIGAAEGGGGPDEAQALDDFLARVRGWRPPEEVAGSQPEPAAVHEQIAHGQLAGDERVPHAEAGHIVHDRRVPGEASLLHQQAEGGGREQLRVGGDDEQRSRVRFLRAAQPFQAEAASQNHPAVLDHGQRDAGDFENLHRPRHIGVQIRGERTARSGFRRPRVW